ncbi:MAG: glycosyltransferase family 39 protein [Gemmatimonadaceae bacterium]
MRKTRVAIALVVIATMIRLALASVIPLFPDETYYWEWSRNLAAGYFDHPPALALLIRAGTTLFGATTFGVRVGAILAGAVASLAMIVMSWRLADIGDARAVSDYDGSLSMLDDPGARAALLLVVIPAALVGFVIATPDAPLLAAIALTLAALERAIASPPRSRDALGWWCAAGVALGVAFCSKYTSVLIPFGVFVALLSRRDLRVRLAEPGPYAATLIALLVLAPNLVWNSHNGWISFAFQLNHGLGQTRGSILGRELALIGGQLGLISPIIAVMAIVAVARAIRKNAGQRHYMLAVIATTVVVFFAISAIRRPVEPNWPIPALVAALPLLATVPLRRRWRAWLLGGSVLGAACILTVAAQAVGRVIPVSPRRDPISKAYGWSDLAMAVHTAATKAQGCSATWIAADRYQDASELAFNLPHNPRVFALNLGGRANQYDLWPTIYSVAQPTDCALIVVDDGEAGERVVRRLGAAEASLVAPAVMTWRGITVGRRAIWIVHGIPAARVPAVELSPAQAAEMSAATVALQSHRQILDSIVSIYIRGPGPDLVTATAELRTTSADQKATIEARINLLHGLLRRSGFASVYRDGRYHECIFVRSSERDSTDYGYVFAPEGCRLAGTEGDGILRVEHAQDAWYAYASPENRSK